MDERKDEWIMTLIVVNVSASEKLIWNPFMKFRKLIGAKYKMFQEGLAKWMDNN